MRKPGVEGTLDHALAVDLQDARGGEPAHQFLGNLQRTVAGMVQAVRQDRLLDLGGDAVGVWASGAGHAVDQPRERLRPDDDRLSGDYDLNTAKKAATVLTGVKRMSCGPWAVPHDIAPDRCPGGYWTGYWAGYWAPMVTPAGAEASRLASATLRISGQLFSAPRMKPGTSSFQRA